MFKLDLEKAEETEITLPTSFGSQRKQGNSRKTSISVSLTTLKPLTVWITTNCGKFFKWLEYQDTILVSWETCMWDKKQLLELNMEQCTGSTGKGVWQSCILSPCLVHLYAEYIMWNARPNEAQAGIKISRKNSTISDMQMILPKL